MNGRAIAVVLFALASGTGAQSAGLQALRFEQAFPADEGNAPLHYQAAYAAHARRHQVEVWVDRGSRLKRVTDARLEVQAERAPGGEEFRMTVLDRQRGIETRVDRSTLYRMGDFTDWFELAQGLRRPRGEYRLARSTAPVGAPQPLQPCDWYALTEGDRTSRICWSTAHRLPMLIASEQGEPLWRVTQLDREVIAAQQFEIHDDGLIRNDVAHDVEAD